MKLKKLACLAGLCGLLYGCASSNFGSQQLATLGTGLAQSLLLSESQVRQGAQQAIAERDSEQSVAPAGHPSAQRLQRIVNRIDPADRQGMNFKVYLSDKVNAFAAPDGSIRVYQGLLDLMDDDEILAVIAHEIGHVRERHSLEQMQKAIATRSAIGALASSGGTVGDLAGGGLGKLATQALDARFSQKDELEADRFAVNFLRRAGEDPSAMMRALQKLGNNRSTFLSSHPSSQERVDALRGLI